MVRFGRGYAIPRQNFLLTPVSDEISTTVVFSTGLYATTAVGDMTIFTSEELAVGIIGVGAEAAAGEAGIGIIEGAVSIGSPIDGVEAFGVSDGISTNASSFSPWKNPGGHYPRRKWKKHKHFKDSFYEQGVEFIPMLANLKQYGSWWNVSTVTSDSILLRHKTTISSDYSIEGRP